MTFHSSGQSPSWRSRMQDSIFGPQGLRAGWSLALFLTAAVPIAIVFDRLAKPMAPAPAADGAWRPSVLAFGDLLTLLVATLAIGLVLWVERRQPADYGLRISRRELSRAGAGVLWGGGVVAAIVLSLTAFGAYTIHGVALGGHDAIRFAFLWLIPSFLGSLFEEATFRGYMLSTLGRGIGFWPAAALLSALFGVLHWALKPGETWIDGLSTALLGLFLCFTVRRTRTISFAVGFHAAFNYCALFIFASPNTGSAGLPVHGHLLDATFRGPAWLTGGAMGLEASVVVFPVTTLLFLAFARRFPPCPEAAGARQAWGSES